MPSPFRNALLLAAGVAVALASRPAPLPASPCAACHRDEVEAYLETGMGRSLARSGPLPGGEFSHGHSGSNFAVTSADGGIFQRVERDGLRSERAPDFAIGSGNHAVGHLVLSGRHIFQSPVAYYSRLGVWDMAPGYERNAHPEFERPVTAECLWCHAGQPRPVAGTLNQYDSPPFFAEAISCDRCHGPADAHLESPSASTILTPSELPARARDSVCEQCHLSGEARVLLPGRSFGDFRPGMDLEEVFSVYLFELPSDRAGESPFKVVSHVEQLAASRCKQASGERLWCGTCHDPHQRPQDTAAHYRQVCLGCHGDPGLADHAGSETDCTGCHMPARQAYDSGHSAFTDHRIAREPSSLSDGSDLWRLRAWRELEGPLRQRNLGLAYARLAERNRSQRQADEAMRNLVPSMRAFPEDDLAIPHALGRLMLAAERTELAVELFEHVARTEPGNPLYLQSLADGLHAQGRVPQAVEALERAIKADPLFEPAYRLLATVHAGEGDREAAARVWRLYLARVPDSIYARQAEALLEAGNAPAGTPGGSRRPTRN